MKQQTVKYLALGVVALIVYSQLRGAATMSQEFHDSIMLAEQERKQAGTESALFGIGNPPNWY